MRKRMVALFAMLSMAAFWSVTTAADSANGLPGTWTGTWEGGGSGKFELILANGGDGKMTGSVNVGTDGGDYTAKFTSLTINGKSLAGKYSYPLDEQGEITLTGTVEGNKISGTWSLGAKGQDGQSMANGTWTVTKK